jgi:delta14-sterol reductase
MLIAVLGSQALGFYLFRSANSQKDRFRNDPTHPSVKHLTYIQTKRGTKLLSDGWWGKARHINYLGDWIMAWSYCLPTGFGMPLNYFYVIYMAILLIHRERRDEDKCSRKYGDDWKKYKAKVPWRIIPYIY